MRTDIENTYEGILLVEYTNSNPNGDMNAGGAPKIDPIDGRTIVSGESLRRKMRDYVLERHGCKPPNDVMIRSGSSMEREDGEDLTLDDMVQLARREAGFDSSTEYERKLEKSKGGNSKKKASKKKSSAKKGAKSDLSTGERRMVQAALCARFWDARVFGFLGGVGTDKLDSSKGPFVISPGISLHPVVDIHETNTRRMVTHEEEKNKRGRTVGNRTSLRYALVQHKFTLAPASARVTGMTEKDLFLALEAMIQCWSLSNSPRRRGVLRGLWIFKQPRLGRRPAGRDWDDIMSVRCTLDDPIEASSFDDFEVHFRHDLLPPQVEVFDVEDILGMIGLDDEDAEAGAA